MIKSKIDLKNTKYISVLDILDIGDDVIEVIIVISSVIK